MKYVIIGNSTAAVNAIEAIRSVDKEGSVTVISDEKYHTYGRPLISYYLYGKTTLEKMAYRPEDFYDKNAVTTIFGIRAAKILPDKKCVLLENGAAVDYDKLLVAVGSRPFVPPMEGIDKVENKFSFMTLDDALAIEKVLATDKKVLIIGAGLIGLKCFEGIADRVKEVAVVDMADRILPSILDAEGAAMVQRRLEEHGAKFYLNDSVAKFTSDGATLKSGKNLSFDILVIAVGVKANIELVKDAGGACARGILTDDTQLTSLKDVYAAGDCTVSRDIVSGEDKVLALLPNAALQGRTAGLNMAGKETHFTNAAAMNSIGFFGVHVMTAGVYDGEVCEEKTENTYKKLFYKDNLLKGFILIGCIERAGIYTSIIRNKTPLDSVNFEILKKEPLLAAFPADYRKSQFTQKV